MARPKKNRRVDASIKLACRRPNGFSPLNADEMEAIRLCDVLELEQQSAARRMAISRPTVQRLLYSGRKKVGDALLNGQAIQLVFPEYVSFVRKGA